MVMGEQQMPVKSSKRLELGFPYVVGWQTVEGRIERAVAAHSGELSGSGAGLGMRDMEFEFKTIKQAKAAKMAVKALKIKGLEVYG